MLAGFDVGRSEADDLAVAANRRIVRDVDQGELVARRHHLRDAQLLTVVANQDRSGQERALGNADHVGRVEDDGDVIKGDAAADGVSGSDFNCHGGMGLSALLRLPIPEPTGAGRRSAAGDGVVRSSVGLLSNGLPWRRSVTTANLSRAPSILGK